MADYTCGKCKTDHDALINESPGDREDFALVCLECGHLMEVEKVFGVQLRRSKPGKRKQDPWEACGLA